MTLVIWQAIWNFVDFCTERGLDPDAVRAINGMPPGAVPNPGDAIYVP